jgi:hypothetical protein
MSEEARSSRASKSDSGALLSLWPNISTKLMSWALRVAIGNKLKASCARCCAGVMKVFLALSSLESQDFLGAFKWAALMWILILWSGIGMLNSRQPKI